MLHEFVVAALQKILMEQRHIQLPPLARPGGMRGEIRQRTAGGFHRTFGAELREHGDVRIGFIRETLATETVRIHIRRRMRDGVLAQLPDLFESSVAAIEGRSRHVERRGDRDRSDGVFVKLALPADHLLKPDFAVI